MKCLFASFVLLLSSAAFACPNLAGKYSCPNQNGNMEPLEISQRLQNGVTIYTMATIHGSDEAIADGVTRQLSGKTHSGNDATLAYTVTCDEAANTLIQDGVMTELDPAGKAITTTDYHMVIGKSAKDGGLATQGTYTAAGKSAEPFDYSCVPRLK